jgi:adenosylcobinamide kinase / adenosylcobinamide-phosphate guanylyltransferase
VTLVVYLGGARSGKSRLAVERATREGAPVVFVATGEPRDEEMTARIALHRQERPDDWQTVEEPVDLELALAGVPEGATAVIDCLSLWVANVFETRPTEELAVAAARAAAERLGLTVVVSNEVGLGIVPDNALARSYRDVLGRVNAVWAAAADEAYFVVAGRALALEEPR